MTEKNFKGSLATTNLLVGKIFQRFYTRVNFFLNIFPFATQYWNILEKKRSEFNAVKIGVSRLKNVYDKLIIILLTQLIINC